MENLIEEKENDPETFWLLSPVSDEEMDGFDGYVYSVGFTDRSGECTGVDSCTQVILEVGWSGSRDQFLQFNRFFAK